MVLCCFCEDVYVVIVYLMVEGGGSVGVCVVEWFVVVICDVIGCSVFDVVGGCFVWWFDVWVVLCWVDVIVFGFEDLMCSDDFVWVW